jgi:hypothetical protein
LLFAIRLFARRTLGHLPDTIPPQASQMRNAKTQ